MRKISKPAAKPFTEFKLGGEQGMHLKKKGNKIRRLKSLCQNSRIIKGNFHEGLGLIQYFTNY